MNFKEYLNTIKKNDGKIISENSQKKYFNVIERDFERKQKITPRSLNLLELKELLKEVRKEEYDIKGNRMYSVALKHYIKYKEIQENIEREDIKEGNDLKRDSILMVEDKSRLNIAKINRASNFDFLKDKIKDLYNASREAEILCLIAPRSSAAASRYCLELGVKFMYQNLGLDEFKEDYMTTGLCNLITFEPFRSKIPNDVEDWMHEIRRLGNTAAHYSNDKVIIFPEDALKPLKIIYDLYYFIASKTLDKIHPKPEFDRMLLTTTSESSDIVNKIISNPIYEKVDVASVLNKYKELNGDFNSFETLLFDSLSEVEKKELNLWTTGEEDDSLQSALKSNFDDWKLFLHPTQRDLVEKSYFSPVLVEGGPGTGKSVVGIYRAVEMAKVYSDKKLLFLTYSLKLTKWLEDKIEKAYNQANIDNNLNIKDVYSYFREIILNIYPDTYFEDNRNRMIRDIKNSYHHITGRKSRKDVELFNSYLSFLPYLELGYEEYIRFMNSNEYTKEASENCWRIFNKIWIERKEEKNFYYDEIPYFLLELIDGNQVEKIYDSIIVDETQDLSPASVKCICNLAKKGKNNLFFLSDPYQKIFSPHDWKQILEKNSIFHQEILRKNYRTTKGIKERADNFFTTHNQLDERFIVDSIVKGGSLQEISISKNRINTEVQNILKEWIRKGFDPYTIGVLAFSKKHTLSPLGANLLENNIKYNILQDELIPNKKYGINLTTYAGSKGLEFRGVILILDEMDTWNKSDTAEYKRQCLKYVAATRARESLIILNID